MNNPAVTTPIMDTQEQIQELERKIKNLRSRAVMELKVKLVDARNRVVEIQKEIEELTGGDNPDTANVVKRPRITITVKQIVEAIRGGATNYKMVADKLGCSKSGVAKKVKEEGKKAGITSSGEKSNFVLAVK
jgi:TolA-binding protein